MFKRILVLATLVCALPAMANAWTLNTWAKSKGGTITVNAVDQTVLNGSVFKSFTNIQTADVSVTALTGFTGTVVVDGAAPVAVPYSNTLSGPGNHSVAATFKANTISVTASCGTGGSVTPRSVANIYYGQKAYTPIKFVFSPKAGYAIGAISGMSGDITSAPGFNGSVVVTIPVNHVFNAPVALSASPTSTSPVANAGVPQTVLPNTLVTLDGSASTGSPAAFTWSQVGTSPAVVTLTPTGANATFTPTVDGIYQFKLTVTGGSIATTSITVTDSLAAAMRNACVNCHNNNGVGTSVYANWSSGSHGTKAVLCYGCHVGANTGGHPGTVPSGVSITSTTTALPVQHGDPSIAAATGYAGSTACISCHTDQFSKWSNTLHNKPLKQLSETGYGVLVNKNNPLVNTDPNDFVNGLNFNASPTLIDKFGVTYSNPFSARVPNAPILGWAGGVYPAGYPTITIGSVTYKIDRAHGGNLKWKQRYQTKIGNAYYVLNVMYNEGNGRYAEYNGQNWYGNPGATTSTNTKTSSWVTNNKPIFSNASGALADQVAVKMMKAYGRGNEGGPSNSSWDNRCTGCHQTGMQLQFNGDTTKGEVVAGYVELNIGCEACHGPGAAHAAAPAASNILQPQKTFVEAGTPNYFKAAEVCGQCHNRTDGAGHLGAAGATDAQLVNLPTESPSRENATERDKVTFYNTNSTDRLVDFVEYFDPGVWGPVDNSGTLQYDGYPFPKFTASNQHHQSNLEIEQGKHGAIWQQQAGNSKGLSCWSCHDPHAANSSNIKSSINGVATNKDDNSLCLACHNSDNTSIYNADFSGLAKASIGTAADELAAVNVHLMAKLGKNITLAQYNASINGTGAALTAFGFNTIKVGNCVSCHMPLTTGSGILRNAATGRTAANGDRGVGDIHSHTMKTVKASAVDGGTNPAWTGTKANGARKANGTPSASVGVNTSCSACHGVSGDATTPTGGWFPASGSGW